MSVNSEALLLAAAVALLIFAVAYGLDWLAGALGFPDLVIEQS